MSDPLVVSLKYPKGGDRSPEPTPTPPPKKKRKSSLVWGVVGFVLVFLFGALGYFYMNGTIESFLKNRGASGDSSQETSVAEETQKEIADVIEQVGRHIILPEGEVPTIATVTEPEKLQDQPFFVNAEVGYKVLLYTGAKKAYLYDPEKDILIEVAPITTEAQ